MAWRPDYTTSARLKSYLRIDDTADDEFIADWVSAVSRNVDDFCGRQFGKSDGAELRTCEGVWDRRNCVMVYEIDDLYDATDLVVTGPSGAVVTGWSLRPLNAPLNGRTYTQLRAPAAGPLGLLSEFWGWPAVPASIPTAIHLQAARLAVRRDSPFGVAGSPSDGSEIRLLARLDVDFITTLKPFVRRGGWAA